MNIGDFVTKPNLIGFSTLKSVRNTKELRCVNAKEINKNGATFSVRALMALPNNVKANYRPQLHAGLPSVSL